MIYPYLDKHPRIPGSVFVAPNASVIGDVTVGEESSVWFGAVIRGDVMPIRIGHRTSIQDNAVVHATGGWAETIIGDDVTVGHAAILHGCTVGDRVLVGMGSILLDACRIGSDTMIGAGSIVSARTEIPSGVLALGRPAKVIRPLRDEERERLRESSALYVGYRASYLK